MVEQITLTIDEETFEGELNETETARAVAEVLPVETDPSFWGEEIYFGIPVEIDQNEEPEEELEVGDLAYWPDGNAFCIFYGPTPNSEDSSPRPASPVTVIGEIKSDVTPLRDLDPWSVGEIRVEKG